MSAAYVSLRREVSNDSTHQNDVQKQNETNRSAASALSRFPSVESVVSDIEKRCKTRALVA